MVQHLVVLALCASIPSLVLAAESRGANLSARLDLPDSICGFPTKFDSCSTDGRSWSNCNDALPNLYPAASSDPPYSVSEDVLRAAIHIPSGFDRSRPAVILFPGTGLPTYDTYQNTLIYQMQKDQLNPVWINPGFETTQFSSLDAQVSAEFASYAINYMAAYTNQKVAIVGASQGTINVQWALKYWRSARERVEDFIALSGDFNGSNMFGTAAEAKEKHDACGPTCDVTPADWQQILQSAYLTTLASNGGDSALVPTTSIWSAQDEVINQTTQPPSANLLNAHNAGYTSIVVQDVCRANPRGNTNPPTGLLEKYTHTGVLFHPLTYPLIRDALAHPGPADLSRIDAAALCAVHTLFAPGLLAAVLETDVALPAMRGCLLANGLFTKVGEEPAVQEYAKRTDTLAMDGGGEEAGDDTSAGMRRGVGRRWEDWKVFAVNVVVFRLLS